MSKNVVVSGYYGFGNFGDEVILSILVEKLKALNAQVTVFSSNPGLTSKQHNTRCVYTFDYLNVVKTIFKNDILVSGGGSLLQDVTSLKSLWYYLAVIFAALFFRKKVIIFAQGIGPIQNKFARFITSLFLKRAAYVSVRDEKSFKLLNDFGVKSDLLCDPVYSLNLSPVENRNIVGVQLRKFKGIDSNFSQKLAESVNKEFSDKKIEIFSLQKSLDYDVCKEFEKLLKKFNPNIKTEIVEENIIERISCVEYLIGMRFHALLVALKAGVKCLAINYDPKVENLAKCAHIPFINIDEKTDFISALTEIKTLNIDSIKQFAQSNSFDWTNFERELA